LSYLSESLLCKGLRKHTAVTTQSIRYIAYLKEAPYLSCLHTLMKERVGLCLPAKIDGLK